MDEVRIALINLYCQPRLPGGACVWTGLQGFFVLYIPPPARHVSLTLPPF